jgi:hypothetical protein
MTAFNYPATAATAIRLLQRFGAAATVRHPTGSAYDPDTGTTVPTYADSATTAAVFAYDQKYIDGTLILQGDQQAYCSPSVAPVQGDQFVWQSTTYTVIAVKPVSPAGVPVLYEAQIRG